MSLTKIIGIAILLLGCYYANAQETEKEQRYNNEIGIEISDVIDGALQFSYERLLGKHISVVLGVGFKGENGLINLSGLDTDKIKTGDITYSGFKIIPEVRYYINKNEENRMAGFYFGAYLKYTNYSSDLNGIYIDDANQEFIIAFDAELNITSIGFMVGYKIPVWKRFSIDFLIAGPGAGFHSYDLKNTRDLPDSFYDDFNEALEQYSLFDILDGEFRFASTKESTRFTIPSFRYGISFGYSF